MAEGVGSGGGKMERTVLEQLKQNKKQTNKKTSQQSEVRGNIPKHNKGYICQTH